VGILAPTGGRIAGLENAKRRVQWEGVRRVPPHCSRPTNAGRCGTTPQTTGINLALNDVGGRVALQPSRVRASPTCQVPHHTTCTPELLHPSLFPQPKHVSFLCRLLFLSSHPGRVPLYLESQHPSRSMQCMTRHDRAIYAMRVTTTALPKTVAIGGVFSRIRVSERDRILRNVPFQCRMDR
jgi:hypothetical protein